MESPHTFHGSWQENNIAYYYLSIHTTISTAVNFMKRRDGIYPNFSELVCFLQDVADDANDPVYGDQSKTDNVKGFSTGINSQMPSAISSSCIPLPTTSKFSVHKIK